MAGSVVALNYVGGGGGGGVFFGFFISLKVITAASGTIAPIVAPMMMYSVGNCGFGSGVGETGD